MDKDNQIWMIRERHTKHVAGLCAMSKENVSWFGRANQSFPFLLLTNTLDECTADHKHTLIILHSSELLHDHVDSFIFYAVCTASGRL